MAATAVGKDGRVEAPREVARVPIPTPAGEFDVRAYQCPSGFVYLLLVRGEIGDGRSVLARLHSECLTGDALGSLRCDCGLQLRESLRLIAAEGRGVLVYATGHEGRGTGLVNKLLAYVLQDRGADTVDANVALGLPVDARDYREAAGVLRAAGIRSIRLLTNNPSKRHGLEAAGIQVEETVPVRTAPHARNLSYLRTKQQRLGHVQPAGEVIGDGLSGALDVGPLLGAVAGHPDRPHVVVKYAQTLDGRIATRSGDSKWISGIEERRLAHGLRAACDAVLVGVGTVLADDPQLTVRLVPGVSPTRVILDSTLRLPMHARVLDGAAPTVVFTSPRSSPARRRELRSRGVRVEVVPPGEEGVRLAETLRSLQVAGVRSLLVEGGAEVITSFLTRGAVDRLVVSIAPTVIGAGTEAVGDLRVNRVADGLTLGGRVARTVGDDIVVAGDISTAASSVPQLVACGEERSSRP